MKTIVLAESQSISHLMKTMFELKTGLIIVTGSDQAWIMFMLLGILGNYQNAGFTVECKNDQFNNYYFQHLATSQTVARTDNVLHYFGAIRDTETLENVFESAKNRITIAAVHAVSAEGVVERFEDMFGDRGQDFERYRDLLTCVVSYDQDGASLSPRGEY